MDKDRKKSICILTDYMIVGGLEQVVCSAIDGLSGEYEITLYALFGGVVDEITNKIGTKAKIVSEYRNQFERVLLMIPVLGSIYCKILIKQEFDYLIVLRPWFIMACHSGIAKKSFFWNHSDKDLMYSKTEGLDFWRRLNKLRLLYGYRGFNGVWVVNNEIKEGLREAFGLCNLSVLANSVDCEEIVAKSKEKIDDSIFLKDKANIVVVSRLSKEKGQIQFLDGLNTLKEEEKCRVVMVGDGPDRGLLEQYAMSHGLGDTVLFMGARANPYPFMDKADFLVLPSITESFGMVLLEAMALKKPVITTDTVGGRFLTKNGQYGLVVSNSSDALAEGISLFLNDPKLREKYAEKGFERAKEFDINVFLVNIKQLLEQ